MWYEIFKFELTYRSKRPETYLFFIFLLAFSVFGVDFIFQGVALGMVKLNAPIVIGKTMGVITGFFMILASMIMGMPMIRDDRYQITHLFYTNPITKSDLLIGRFLGSLLILILIFSGIPIGMMLGELMPWHLEGEMLPFRLASYITSYFSVVLPTLFFGAALFFVTGSLSRKLLVVYTQGIFLFVVFMLTKSITNQYMQAILDPFSLTTITYLSEGWTVAEKNTLLLPFSGALMVNKLFWIGIGLGVLCWGYYRFSFSIRRESKKPIKQKVSIDPTNKINDINLPTANLQYNLRSQLKQYTRLSIFYTKSILKENSFWAIVICAVIIIMINSISLGTVYGVDSYPTTYFIIEELQEMSMYFFIIILLFYSGELYWKERDICMHLMADATPISSLVRLSSKMTGLISIYIVLMLSLILSGLIFQLINGYYQFNIPVYFSGFFIEILPFLTVYTFFAFFIQALVNHKFLAILISLISFIIMVACGAMGYDHILFYFGGGGLPPYSEMNGYGHFMTPYLWTKMYWILFGIMLLVLASLLSVRGTDKKLTSRLISVGSNASRNIKVFASTALILFLCVGTYNYYQTHIMNEVWTNTEQQEYRADYEKTLKPYEHQPQPNIIAANLNLELYPENQSYELEGEYILKNEEAAPIHEIHIQQLIESDITLSEVQFSESVTLDSQYLEFHYNIYRLAHPLEIGDSLTMSFRQTLQPKGYNSGSVGSVLDNGTFIRNNEFPTLGYNSKYELSDSLDREQYELTSRPTKAAITDMHGLQEARSGSDSQGIRTKIKIGTAADQTAITSGKLINSWHTDDRNYFEYNTVQPIINFYAMLSGKYEVARDQWLSTPNQQNPVDLEIYYHPQHTYNLDRMMNGMKASLDYYTTHFSPYQYEQLRIVEFPRYEEFAQSFPCTIPFSESIGFMLDIDDSIDIDMTFFVTAHEVAHQWWGMQIETANVKGRNFVLETLSQYSALMVFKQKYSKAKVEQFLALQQDLYNVGRQKSTSAEIPLYLVENENYIYYNKGAIVMYKLYELIGEENLNLALRSFLKDWNSLDGEIKTKSVRYATSEDLIGYILETGGKDSRENIIKLFSEI